MSLPPRVALLPHWHRVRRVLAVRLDNLGDLLMTTPALAAIRHSLPQAELTLLTSPAGAAAQRHLPDIHDAIAFQAPWMKAGGDATQPLQEMTHRLAARRFDAAIIFTVCTQSALPAALLCLLAGIPLRLAHSRENPYSLLSDWVAETDKVGDGMRHEVERQLALVGAVGMQTPATRLRFRYADEDRERLRGELEAAGFDPARPYFVVHPGASAPSRRYPAERFGAAARLIADHSGCQAVFTGSADERELVDSARRAMGGRAVSLVGRLDLGQLGALIDGAQVLVANNSGPAHIAAALATPVVDLYAQTNPQHTPWQVAARVLHEEVACRHCLKSVCPEGHHACLRGVSPQQVAQAALELMGRREMTPERARGSGRLSLPAFDTLPGLPEVG